MDGADPQAAGGPQGEVGHRLAYEAALASMRSKFEQTLHEEFAGSRAVLARSRAVDTLIAGLWQDACATRPQLQKGLALVAVGGYGRQELFPYSDVDLMFLLSARSDESAVQDVIRVMNQQMWDCGLRVSPMTRTLAECEKFQPENVEFTLALLDARWLAGDVPLFERLSGKGLTRLIERDRRRILKRLAEVTRLRHAKYGDTLFHLEPNLKDCPGGLRDAHVYGWLRRLSVEGAPAPDADFAEARAFLLLVRVFLHLRHRRDDNVLDWQAQDEAAAASLGLSLPVHPSRPSSADAAYWMRVYFRHARSVERTESLLGEEVAPRSALVRVPLLRRLKIEAGEGYEIQGDRLVLWPAEATVDPAHDPEVMLNLFGVMAQTGARLSGDSARRLQDGLPLLSNRLDDGHGLWLPIRRILLGPHAGRALRVMHQLGLLELILPEFHGIDALVIRDAYHRYTVDEHTFVLIDTLHALERMPGRGSAEMKQLTGLDLLRARFALVLRDLPHPELLYLAALLHDTGKGRAGVDHAEESARMAQRVLTSLELDPRERSLVLGLIRRHLEMSAALRRDVFDPETLRSFAARVPTPEALRLLTLFTYADISAVHPDALTPWKAENLLRLHNNAAHYLDRLVDEQRLGPQDAVAGYADQEMESLIARITASMPGRRAEVNAFLNGLPKRYLLTREPAQIQNDLEMARRLGANAAGAPELSFQYGPEGCELTVITHDRSLLFADIAGALAAWGMNIVTANAFSNASHLVVDTFRFTDPFRTLELNEPERARFLGSVYQVVTGEVTAERLLKGRRRRNRAAIKVKVAERVDFDAHASSHSTLLQVVAQDTPGLLYRLAATLVGQHCNIEVALIDTEGEMAIDVFYVTQNNQKLDAAAEMKVGTALRQALEMHGQ